jgi:hypothetical protein
MHGELNKTLSLMRGIDIDHHRESILVLERVYMF